MDSVSGRSVFVGIRSVGIAEPYGVGSESVSLDSKRGIKEMIITCKNYKGWPVGRIPNRSKKKLPMKKSLNLRQRHTGQFSIY